MNKISAERNSNATANQRLNTPSMTDGLRVVDCSESHAQALCCPVPVFRSAESVCHL